MREASRQYKENFVRVLEGLAGYSQVCHCDRIKGPGKYREVARATCGPPEEIHTGEVIVVTEVG